MHHVSTRSWEGEIAQKGDAYTLSLDVCGPKPGKDQDRKAGRYFTVGVFVLPVSVEAQKVVSLAPWLDQDDGLEVLLPEVEAEEREIQRKGDDVKTSRSWKSGILQG